jgi:hypothetical protein
MKKFISKEVIGCASVFVVLISLYFYTIAPTVSLWDCGEFIGCSHILGVAHPPGTPLYILIGRVFDIFLPFKEVAKRINFFSVISSAIAGGFLYLVILKVFNRFKKSEDKETPISSHLIAVFSSIGAGFCFSVWDSAVEAEVYTASLLILIMGIWIVLHWDDNRDRRGSNNLLLLLVYLLALSFGVHLLPLLLVPGALVFIILTDWKVFKNPKLISSALILVLIGISTYLYLLIRAHANPGINESDPTTWAKLLEVIARKQYGSDNIFIRHTAWQTNYGQIRALIEQLKVFFKYFSWQFFPYPRESTGILLRYISVLGTYTYVLIGLWGMFVHFREDKKSFYLLFILYILITIGLVVYLNHEFSPSDPNPSHQPREPRERDYFWSSGFFFFMFYVAVALYWIYERLKKRKIVFGYCALGLSFVIGFIPLVSNIKSHANRRENWIAHEYAYNLLVCPRENSILFTNGDNDTFPLWFLQEVKGFRKFDPENKKGVQVACLALMNTEWYIRQLKRAGIPMDFVSPFKESGVERAYLQKKRNGETNLDFEDWIIENLYFLKTTDGKTILLKDVAIRNIILSSQGIRPTYEALTLPADSFVNKYIKSDFNPSVNIYYSASVSPGNMNWLRDHLLLESLLFRLVGEKGKEMIDIPCFLDLFKNKLNFSSVDNIKVYKSPAARTIMQNYISICYRFGSSLKNEVIPSNILVNSGKQKIRLSAGNEEKLKESAVILEEGLSLAEDYPTLAAIFNELRGIYNVFGKPDSLAILVENLKNKKDLSLPHFFKGQLLLDKLTINKNIPEGEKGIIKQEVENEFKKVLKLSEEEAANGYIGLLDLYDETGNSRRKDSLVEELLMQPKIFSYVFMYNYDFMKDTAMSIYLLKKWLEVNPDDRRAKNVLKSLGANSFN